MTREYWYAVFMRAWHAVWETASATLPATFVITPAMIQHFDWHIIYVVIAWVLTALFAGFISLVKSLAVGIPEAEYLDTIDYLDDDEYDDDVEDTEDEDGKDE